MAENRMDIKVLQKVMGHANVTITMQTYTHVTDSSRIRDEFDRIDELAVDF
jgi:Site-specific recombinase XerD